MGAWSPKDRKTVSHRVPCLYLKGSQTQKGKLFLEKPPGVSFYSAKELNWASRRRGERKEEFPVLPE